MTVGNAIFVPVPSLPKIREYASPQVVLVMDQIRRDLDDKPGFEEFCWFAREYPRCYRFHFNGATFRLRTMHKNLSAIHQELVKSASNRENAFEISTNDPRVDQLYWDFESYLSEISVALDLLAR